MSNIFIDCTTLSRKTDGLTQYTLSILLELLKNTSDTYTLLCRKDELPDNYICKLNEFSNNLFIEIVNISPIGPKRDFQFFKWFRKNKKRFDIFYEPSAQYPAGLQGGIYTIHDILYEEFPEKLGKYSWLKKKYLHKVVKRGLKKASNVIAVSQFTKDEICKYHGNKYLKKISVIYEGYEHLKNVKIDYNNVFVKQILSFNEKFFLYIGSSRGHKNLHNLFLAFEKSNVNWKLVVVGRMDRLESRDKVLVDRINKDSYRIVFTGWLDDSQMYSILAKANGFVFPSKSEGFGIPILESWYFKVPLLCSDIPVFNEIANDACIKFNPYDIDDIANKLRTFSERSENENKLLIELQTKHLKLYSWSSAAMKIYKIVDKLK